MSMVFIISFSRKEQQVKTKSGLWMGIAAIGLAVWFGGFEVSVSQAGTPTLSAEEEVHLIFMREEEKLARDVYLTLAGMYPEVGTFYNIATKAEQSHTDSVLAKLDKYGVPDPNPQTNDLPDSIGVFTGELFGDYFTEKFEILTDWGSVSLLDALYVGAFIEELDMLDIAECPKVIVDGDNGIEDGGCGLVNTDRRDLQNLLNNLLEGSKNHLRAYVSQIEAIIGEGEYQAQVLSQAEVDEILGR